MPRSRDDWDPSATDPVARQLIRDEEVLSREEREASQRGKKKRYRHRNQPPSEHWPEGPFRDYAPELPEPSHGASLMKRIFDFLLSTPDPWRLCVGFAVIFLVLSDWSGRGWISIPGLPQFAEAKSVTAVIIYQLNEQIEGAVRDHCVTNSGKAKGYYYRKRAELEQQFKEATRDEPKVPTCKDLGVPWIEVNEP